jgi:hypothetical protein
MSFSSASWTVPELCVWIAIRDKGALNNLASVARKSLKSADLLHPGAYAARDEVLAAAQDGRITVTCLGERSRGDDPPEARDGRLALTKNFWSGAELDDATSHLGSGARWCVARPVHARDRRAYRELLVRRDEVLKEWPERTSAMAEPSNATRDSTDPTVNNAGGAARRDAPVSEAVAYESASSKKAPATDGQKREWMGQYRRRLKDAGKKHGREIILAAAMDHFSVLYNDVRSIWDASQSNIESQ